MQEMIPIIIEFIGLIGILIISCSGTTQLYKVLKTHSVQDLSLIFFILLLTGIILLSIYTVWIGNFVYSVGNVISLIITIGIIICILKWR